MIDQNEVKKKAKDIMDSFLKAIESVPRTDSPESATPSLRTEEGRSCDPSFRERFLRNAKRIEDDHLVMEKGTWT